METGNKPRILIRRIGAFLTDILLLFVVIVPASFLLLWVTGYMPRTGPEIWHWLLLTASLPAWLYFILCDHSARGATVGKRLFKLRAVTTASERISLGRALVRTAVKLIPWEVTHVSGFGLANQPALQTAGLIAAYGLIFAYLIVLAISRGRRSVHDLVVRTEVQSRQT